MKIQNTPCGISHRGCFAAHTEVQSFLFLHEHPNALQSWKKIPKCDRRGDQCEDATPPERETEGGHRYDAGNEVGTGDAKRCGKRDDLCAGQALFHEGLHDHQHQVGEGCRVGGSLVAKGADADIVQEHIQEHDGYGRDRHEFRLLVKVLDRGVAVALEAE